MKIAIEEVSILQLFRLNQIMRLLWFFIFLVSILQLFRLNVSEEVIIDYLKSSFNTPIVSVKLVKEIAKMPREYVSILQLFRLNISLLLSLQIR